ncbi:LysM domain-containing protein [Frankia sp. Cas3]|uniref:LysM peptidoglycan-binding domain-containing protein n=1 Tax=Frankia sp. Cas3 TaxID=3073926 RepID=UPI002AD43679|nr:LysM domain-containing protein [Frankia sp. Cas3]
MFPPTSRYAGIDTAEHLLADGRTVVHLRRRFPPSPESLATVAMHTVVDGDRLDNVTARYLGDPEQFWQVCDANRAMRPDELTERPGRRLRITLPVGISGISGISGTGAGRG